MLLTFYFEVKFSLSVQNVEIVSRGLSTEDLRLIGFGFGSLNCGENARALVNRHEL